MTTKELLRKITDLINADRRAQLQKRGVLAEILEKLAKKEASLLEKLANETDDEQRQRLIRKLDVLKAQRKKGQALSDELKDADDVD